MKKIIYILIAIMVLTSSMLHAADFAIDKGAITLDGSLGIVTYHGDLYGGSDNNTHVTAQGVFQRFFVKGLAIGFNVLLDFNCIGSVDDKRVAVGPTITYYLGSDISRSYPFLRASASIGNADIRIPVTTPEYPDYWGTIEDEGTSYNLSAAAGAVYFLSDHVAFTGMLTYTHRKIDFDDTGLNLDQNRMDFTLGLGAFIY